MGTKHTRLPRKKKKQNEQQRRSSDVFVVLVTHHEPRINVISYRKLCNNNRRRIWNEGGLSKCLSVGERERKKTPRLISQLIFPHHKTVASKRYMTLVLVILTKGAELGCHYWGLVQQCHDFRGGEISNKLMLIFNSKSSFQLLILTMIRIFNKICYQFLLNIWRIFSVLAFPRPCAMERLEF